METKEDIAGEFSIDLSTLNGCSIIYSDYSREGYEGDAFVLFARDGKYYWVFGSHCSCYGLENQWDPEEVTAQEVLYRINNGHNYGVFGQAIPFLKSFFSGDAQYDNT